MEDDGNEIENVNITVNGNLTVLYSAKRKSHILA